MAIIFNVVRKGDELTFEAVRDHLLKQGQNLEQLEDTWDEIRDTAYYTGHRASPEEPGYRKAVLALAEGYARANAAAYGKDLEAAEKRRVARHGGGDSLAMVVCAEAMRDRRVSAFRERKALLDVARRYGTGLCLRLLSAQELLRTGKMSSELRAVLTERTIRNLQSGEPDLSLTRLFTLERLLRLPIRHHLRARGRFWVGAPDLPGNEIRYFEEQGTLQELDLLTILVSQEYGLSRPDVASLILEGRPAELLGGSVCTEKNARFGALDTVVLRVPAHLDPSEVASMYAIARAGDGRPRGLGPRSAALLRMWSAFVIEGGDPEDLDSLFDRWNVDNCVPTRWRFVERFRFNEALTLARGRVLRVRPGGRRKAKGESK